MAATVISDLFDQEGFRRGADVLRHHRFEPHLVQVHTAAEGLAVRGVDYLTYPRARTITTSPTLTVLGSVRASRATNG